MDSNTIATYTSNFRKYISNYIKDGVVLGIDIYNCGDEGAVLNIRFLYNSLSSDKEIKNFNKISDVLSHIQQNFFVGLDSMKNITFSGTNLMMDAGRILIIKDANNEEWTPSKAKNDVSKIVHPPQAD